MYPSIRKIIGDWFWTLYQFFGALEAPNWILDITSGIAQWLWKEYSIVHIIHHCWHCPDYDFCELRKKRQLHELGNLTLSQALRWKEYVRI